MVWKKYRKGKRRSANSSTIETVAKDRIIANQQNLSDSVREQVLQAIPITSPFLLDDSSYLTIVETFKEAGKNQKLVLLEYITAEQEFGVRLVEFYSTRRTLAGNILVYGWSYKSNAIRSYRLDRVVSVMLTRVSFEARWPIELDF